MKPKINGTVSFLYRLSFILPPFIIIGCYLAFVGISLPADQSGRYFGLVLAYFFPPFGKESIITAMIAYHIPVLIVASTVIIMDVICSFILCYNWWFAEWIIGHLPLIDRGYRKLHEKASKYRRKTWISISLIIFMLIPFQGTGAISTSILGRLLGLPANRVFTICVVGSVITTTIITCAVLGIFKIFAL
jgi:uncharacterized membrane protein